MNEFAEIIEEGECYLKRKISKKIDELYDEFNKKITKKEFSIADMKRLFIIHNILINARYENSLDLQINYNRKKLRNLAIALAAVGIPEPPEREFWDRVEEAEYWEVRSVQE